jgi:hypothetical protein
LYFLPQSFCMVLIFLWQLNILNSVLISCRVWGSIFR